MTLIQKLNPINKAEEKKKFFFDNSYNPQFSYLEKITKNELELFGEVSDELLPQTKRIMDAVIKKWGTETTFLAEVEGDVLNQEELVQIVQKYLEVNSLDDKLEIKLSNLFVSPASMTGNTLNFRLPISQRRFRVHGTLDHEIGTHYFRRLNDEKQPWYKKRDKYHLGPYLETEEGLAVLHAHLFLNQGYLWFTALYYYAIFQSSSMSFAELYKDLKRYIDNPERRWNITLRAKRGIADTSVPGAWSKDQIYLKGVISVLKWLKKNNYDPRPLYIGKIAHEDLAKARHLNAPYEPELPGFLKDDNLDNYVAAVKSIEKLNLL